MPFIAREEPFVCEQCGTSVEPLKKGSYRNHCPRCLFSKHVDDKGPGDRASLCGGLMEPVDLDFRSNKGWMIIHKCVKCKKEIPNMAAPDDDLSMMND
jgi:DNA-directed RNA polymerase subunit RPC12/RpoP